MCVCDCVLQIQALPSIVSVCPHISVARVLKTASYGSGLLISQMCSWKLVSVMQSGRDIQLDCCEWTVTGSTP